MRLVEATSQTLISRKPWNKRIGAVIFTQSSRILPEDERCRPAEIARDRLRRAMGLSFPNQSRAHDATRHAVRFWGHDNAMEASFFVTEDALRRLQPDLRSDEAGLLAAFDANRALIYETAAKVYARGNRGSYDLLSSDF